MNAEKRPPNAKSDSFHEELTLMESARTALAQDDAAVCIRALDRYERKFPHGMFAEEAPVMRLEALVARGDEEQARSLGTSLLAKNPDGPHASRIRSLLASTH
jgi:outer membrane protein assembly factor BamD (BamD/ComL family)